MVLKIKWYIDYFINVVLMANLCQFEKGNNINKRYFWKKNSNFVKLYIYNQILQ
jgi:hypothetical protein